MNKNKVIVLCRLLYIIHAQIRVWADFFSVSMFIREWKPINVFRE